MPFVRTRTLSQDDAEPTEPTLLRLDQDRAVEIQLVGGKAAALAQAAADGLPTLPGVVLTTAFCRAVDGGRAIDDGEDVARAAELAAACIVRSSSVVEDTGESSAAGQFESVLDVRGPEQMADAVRTVLDSRQRAGAADHPIAVLVQPMVEPDLGGVLFGVDPVSGRSDRRVVTAVSGQPDALVSGEVDGSHYELDRRGDVISFDQRDGAEVPSGVLRGLVELADKANALFGSPQDVEWALVEGRLVLLQSRPVTTEVRGVPVGPVYGPGPVAETFPERLAPLEADLWVPPLEQGVREALRLAGAVPADELDGRDLVISVGGMVAIDLERTGEIDRREDRPPWYAVTRRVRRLRSAWRIGRLRTALPALAQRLVDRADEDLEALPPLSDVTDRQLVALLGRGRVALRALHAHEVLMGLLTDSGEAKLTGTSVAMRVLAEARTEGRSDAEIVDRSPVVLALTPPRIAPATQLPDASQMPSFLPGRGGEPGDAPRTSDAGVAREALRLRVRWLQELTGRAAWQLGERLAAAGQLRDPEQVKFVTYDELAMLVTRRSDLDFDRVDEQRRRFEFREPPRLPARFRLSREGEPVPHRTGGDSGGGTGAGGGRGTGPVTHDADDPPTGSVLVVRNLSPAIGPVLDRLAGVVSETGSVLAHLAILAREAGVPTVVGHAGAVDEFADGARVSVDGDSGRVTLTSEEDDAS